MKNVGSNSRAYKIIVGGILILTVALICSHFSLETYRKDPLYFNQWYLNNTGNRTQLTGCMNVSVHDRIEAGIDIDFEKAQNLLAKHNISLSEEVVVAVIDTGVDNKHEDLKNRMWKNKREIECDLIDNDENGVVDDIYGYDFVNSGSQEGGVDQHGTMCAGLISAERNGKGIQGVAAVADVKIMSLNVMTGRSDCGGNQVKNIIDAIKYAEKNGAKICNLSFSVSSYEPDLYDAINSSSMLFVVSAGNKARGIDLDKLPASLASYKCRNIITVANVEGNGKINRSSNYGKESVDVAAPGTHLITTTMNNRYGWTSGTSFAAPVVSGIAAILFSIESNSLSAVQVKTIICNSCKKMESLKGKVKCEGMVNLANSIQYYVEMFDSK